MPTEGPKLPPMQVWRWWQPTVIAVTHLACGCLSRRLTCIHDQASTRTYTPEPSDLQTTSGPGWQQRGPTLSAPAPPARTTVPATHHGSLLPALAVQLGSDVRQLRPQLPRLPLRLHQQALHLRPRGNARQVTAFNPRTGLQVECPLCRCGCSWQPTTSTQTTPQRSAQTHAPHTQTSVHTAILCVYFWPLVAQCQARSPCTYQCTCCSLVLPAAQQRATEHKPTAP
jgi:hypothetical protein